ncbi:TPA: hypothetical protein EYP12_05905, partial [Candidatus Bipolaricaulota bacterium]|nr:hypothetical protein [Candidatus Bipolaricaulota bacterium]
VSSGMIGGEGADYIGERKVAYAMRSLLSPDGLGGGKDEDKTRPVRQNRRMRFRRDVHHRTRELLSAYIDGELPPKEKAAVEEHLRECAECRRDLETLRRTVALLRETPRVAIPRSFVIRPADVERTPAPLRIPVFMRMATALGTAVLVLVAGLYLLMQAISPAAPIPKAVAPALERGYKVIEVSPTAVVELLEKAVTKEVAKEVRPPVGSQKAPEVAIDKLTAEAYALSPLPTPATVAPEILAPSPAPKPATLPTPTPAPVLHPTPSPSPSPKATVIPRLSPTPYRKEITVEKADSWIWLAVALALAGAGIGLWAYYRSR